MYDCILSKEQLKKKQLYRGYSICLRGPGAHKSGRNIIIYFVFVKNHSVK